MNAEDVIESHPLRLLEGRKAVPKGEVSLILARSGVGKSAAIINFGLDEILSGNQVYHFSAGMPSEKTHQYYQKILVDYTRIYPPTKDYAWEDVYQHFTVISYLDPEKMIEDLDSETETILSSTHLKPSLILIDGLDFGDNTGEHLAIMDRVAKKHNVKLLASMRIHRNAEGIVDLMGPVKVSQSLSDHVYFLEPDPAKGRVDLELVNQHGKELLPIYFCPNDFIFKAR